MYSKHIQNKDLKNDITELSKKGAFCEASQASTEIMLERVCNGKEIDFPFSH